jgi:hypothetical protein
MPVPTPFEEVSELTSETLAAPERVPGEQLGASTTTLISDLANQPWQEAYVLGKGINAVTSALCGQAIEAFTVKPAEQHSSQTTFSSVTSTSDVDTLISASASASYNVGGLNLNASTEYLNKVKQSKMDMTILATHQVIYQDYDTINMAGLRFTPQAQEFLKASNFEGFRNQYGDYFLGGSKRVATFRAVYTISSDSEQALQEVKAAIGAKVPDMFSAEGEAAFKKATSNSHISVSFNLDMQGMPANAPDRPSMPASIDSMQQYLKWFQDNNAPLPSRAELIHYSQIDNKIPTTLPISPDVFVTVGTLYSDTYLLRIMLNSLPSTWQSACAAQVQTQVNTVMANSQTIVGDPTTLADLFKKATSLLTEVTNLNQRYIFLQSIRSMQPSEPGVGSAQESSSSYGSNVYPNAANDPLFVIQTTNVSYEDSWEIGHMDHDLTLAATGPIVQWKLQQNKSDDGQWWKNQQGNNSSYVLLNNGASIHCRSGYDRGYNNTLTIWYVDKSLVPNYTPGTVGTQELAVE